MVILGRLRPAYCWLDPGTQSLFSINAKETKMIMSATRGLY